MTQTTIEIRDYVQHTAQMIDLTLDSDYLPGVIDNFNTIAAIAALVTEFKLPEDLEIAPTFTP